MALPLAQGSGGTEMGPRSPAVVLAPRIRILALVVENAAALLPRPKR
jgi:hypothetical protein